MSSNVGGVNSRNNNAEISSAQKRIPEVTVKKGENLTIIAKRFGMTKAEFVKWTGLKGIVYVGQKIKLPAAHVPKGKGIYALAREYNMTMDEFCKLNNIKDRQNYQAKADEFFYVKNKKTEQNPKTSKKTETKPKTTKPSSSTKGIAEAGAMVGKVVGKVINQERWGSAYSPEEIGEKLYELSGKYYGAVGRPDFDALINEINPKNASAVIENYTKNKKNKDKESLILTITHEIKSDKGARKAAAMKVYDALAAEKSAPAEKRKEFTLPLAVISLAVSLAVTVFYFLALKGNLDGPSNVGFGLLPVAFSASVNFATLIVVIAPLIVSVTALIRGLSRRKHK